MSLIEKQTYKDVELIRVGRFPGRINTTVLLFCLGDTVIDCGPPNQWRWVRQCLQERRPQRVLLTHHHEDHAGNGAAIQDELGIPVHAPEAAVPFLADGFPVHFYRRVVWGKPRRFRPRALVREIETASGLHLLPIPAPGHSPDMTCYLVPERGWLFTGDLFIGSHPKFTRVDEDPNREIDSLQRVLQHDFDLLFCAHRGLVPRGRQALQDKLAYLLSLREKVFQLYAKGKSPAAIRRQLLGRETALSWFTHLHFAKRNLIRAFLPQPEAHPS